MKRKYKILRNKMFKMYPFIFSTIFIFINILQFLFQMSIDPIFRKKIENEYSIDKPQSTIDIVYTWVNGSDPLWVSSFRYVSKKNRIKIKDKLFKMRFIDGDELRFSLRSIEKYALHIINKIYIIVANNSTQIPCWLNTSHAKIRIITHHMIFGSSIPQEFKNDSNSIFNFNSVAIENCLTNIPGLSNEFIYFNDDFFIGRPVSKSDFFDTQNRPKIYTSEHDYESIEIFNEKYSNRAVKDFSSLKYAASLTYTLLLFQKKFKNLTFLDPFHVAYPTTKNLMIECEQLFGDQIKETTKHPFRSVDDVKMQFITFQYGYLMNKITTVNKSDEDVFFTSLNMKSSMMQLERMAKIKPKLFAVNCDNHIFLNRFRSLLFVWFSKPSSFELKAAEMPHIPRAEINYWKMMNVSGDP